MGFQGGIETGVFRGKVTGPDGRPVNGATLSVHLGSPEPATRVTGEDGSFAFEPIRPGNYFIRVAAPGFMVSTKDVVVVRGKPVDVILQLEKGEYEMTGSITEDGRKPLRADVTLLKSGIVVQSARTGERTGAFRFRYLVGGSYEVQAVSVCHSAQAWSGTVSGNTKVDLVLPVVEGCTVMGRCDVCGLTKEVRYCQFCHAFICSECRHNYPERIKAMIRRRLSKKDRTPKTVDAEYEKLLVERRGCAGCP